MTLAQILTDHTIRTVVLGAALLGLISGVLSCFAVLRRQSLLGDAVAHAALPGVCLGFLVAGTRDLGWITLGALATGGAAALAISGLTETTRLKSDAALAAVLGLFFAAGIVLLTFIQGRAGGAQAGLDAFLFGQAAALRAEDLRLMAALGGAALLILALFWKEAKVVTFDPIFAATLGLPARAIGAALTLLTALAVVIGLQMVGVVLMAAMLIAPAVAARQWTRTLEGMVLTAAGFGIAAGVIGALISAARPGLATGPLIVLAASAGAICSLLLAPERGVLARWIARARSARRLAEGRVLATLADLSHRHRDPTYPAEEAMIGVLHGPGTARALAGLETRGLVAPVSHMASEGQHWVLTPAGRTAAGQDARDRDGAAWNAAADGLPRPDGRGRDSGEISGATEGEAAREAGP